MQSIGCVSATVFPITVAADNAFAIAALAVVENAAVFEKNTVSFFRILHFQF